MKSTRVKKLQLPQKKKKQKHRDQRQNAVRRARPSAAPSAKDWLTAWVLFNWIVYTLDSDQIQTGPCWIQTGFKLDSNWIHTWVRMDSLGVWPILGSRELLGNHLACLRILLVVHKRISDANESTKGKWVPTFPKKVWHFLHHPTASLTVCSAKEVPVRLMFQKKRMKQ